MKPTTSIFNISGEEEFRRSCLETFRYQYENIPIYKRFSDCMNVDVEAVNSVEKIPFLPIAFFKNHRIIARGKEPEIYFQSSGTTGTECSQHYLAQKSLYERSILESFSKFIGDPKDFVFLGLLPNYLEREHSSLIYMVNFLMSLSRKRENGYFLHNHSELLTILRRVEKENQKTILFGVSFALLDFLDHAKASKLRLEHTTVIETGGMKGRKEEITKDELLKSLQEGFGTEKVFSEYSMTELLSQAYSLGRNKYNSPAWMKVLIRNIEDPLSYLDEGKSGGINIIDLANRYSCSFIATQDLGRKSKDGFEVLGRIDQSDIRGCSLLVPSLH